MRPEGDIYKLISHVNNLRKEPTMLIRSNPGLFSRSIALFLLAAMLGAALAVLGTGGSGTAAANGPVASHGDTSMIEERDWYAPEGCTRPGFDTWVLVQNPDARPATVTMLFQLPAGESAPPYTFEMGANTRRSVHLNELEGLSGGTDVSTHVVASKRVVVGQSMYFDYNGMKGGNDSLASPCPYPTWNFAEGYTGGAFDTWILVQNPMTRDASVTLDFQLPDGAAAPAYSFTLQAGTRKSIKLDELPGLSSTDVSTNITSTVPVVAERSMYFDYKGRKGGSSSPGVNVPGRESFLSEGYTGDGFDTWVLLQNPGDESARVKLDFQLEDGSAVNGVELAMSPESRKSVLLNDLPGLGGRSVSTHVTSDKPVIAERAMYFDYYGRDGGECAAASDAPNATWYLPEGCTGPGFDTWVLLQNPTDRTANVKLRFQGPPGYAIPEHALEVPPNGRETVLLNSIEGFPATDVSTTVLSDVPVVAERSTYFDNGVEDGGTCSPGYRPNELMDNAIILDGESLSLVDGRADGQDDAVTFSRTTTLLRSVRVGDIIIAGSSSRTPDGFMRKVTALEAEGRGVTFTTTQASLTEAVKFGNFFGEVDRTGAGTSGRTPLATINYDIDTGNRSVSIKTVKVTTRVQLGGSLYLNLSIGIKWKVIIPVPYLKYFQVENDMHALASFDADADPGSISGSKAIYTYSFPPVSVGPVVFLPRLRVNLGVEGNPSTHCDFGVIAEVKHLDAGIVYDGSWHTPHNLEAGASITRWNPPAGGDITVYAEEEFDFLLYGLVGPYISMQEGPHFHVNQAENPWWTLGLRIRAKAGVDINVLWIIDIKFDATIYNLEIPITHAPYRPEIKAVNPTSGNVFSSVTITGVYFGSSQGESYVSFGGTRASPVTSWTDKQITCGVPPGASGVVPVKVTTGAGTSNGIDFSVVPWLDHLEPASGTAGSSFALCGSGFGPAQGKSFVVIGGRRAECGSWKDDQVTCTVPGGLSRVVQVSITTEGGASRQLSFGIVPRIDRIDPNAGVVGSAVSITGASFGPEKGVSSVSFGDTAATEYASWADGKVVVKVPPGVSGAIKVTVTTEGGMSNAVDFRVIPLVSALDPTSGTVSTAVKVSGTGFGRAQGSAYVTFGTTKVTEYASWSDSQVVCGVPPGAGGRTSVRVTTAGGTSAPAAFRVVPSVTSVVPGSGAVGDAVTIEGSAFVQGNSFVSFGSVRASRYVSWSYGRVVCIVPPGVSGVSSVRVTTSGGASNAVDFSVIPTITRMDQYAAEIGARLTITGTAFGDSQGSSQVTFGPALVTSTISWSDTSVVLRVPDGTWGTVPVTLTTAGGVSNTVPLGIIPTVGGLTPAAGAVGSAVMVKGNGFGPEQAGSLVTFGDTPVTRYLSWRNEQVLCEVPLGASGVEEVKLTTGGGTSTKDDFKVVPTVTSVTPPSAPPGALVTVAGSAFGPTQGSSFVSFGPWRAEVTAWSDGRIECRIPAGAAGRVPLAVTTAGGTSGTVPLGVQPYIARLNPNAGCAGSVVTISGAGFGTGKGRSMVLFGGTPVVSYRGWADRWIKVVVPEGPTGGAISVVTSGGVSNSRDFTVLTPVWYLAEGTCAWGFNTYLSVMNPNAQQVSVVVTYMTPKGPCGYPPIKLPPTSQTTIVPREMLGFDTDFATRVVCVEGKTIAVDRTMQWTGPGAPSPEGHCSIGTTAPATTWFMPEGCSAFGFETWLLIQNPNNKEAACTVTYMVEGAGPKVFSRKVPANSRCSYDMSADIGPAEAGIEVSSTVPVIAERASYRNHRRLGHESLGTTLPARGYFKRLAAPTSQDCYLAEGSTRKDFSTYLLLLNPNDTEANVTVTYMHEGGPLPQEPVVMPPQSRKTIMVNRVLPDADFAIHVHADAPVAAERAMYWGGGTANGEAGHSTVALSSLHDSYYFPDGQTGDGHETFTLIQNPSNTPVPVDVKYFSPEGKVLDSFTVTVPAGSRRTLDMSEKVPRGRAAVYLRCRDLRDAVMAERAMYWHHRGAGTVTTGGFEDLAP